MKSPRGLAILAALLLAAAVYFVLFFLQVADALLYAILAAAAGYILFSTLGRVWTGKQNKRYAQIEAAITPAPFHKALGDWDTGDLYQSGRIYFCDDQILCVQLNKQDHTTLRIPREEIARLDFDDVHIFLLKESGGRITLTLQSTQGIRSLLQERSW